MNEPIKSRIGAREWVLSDAQRDRLEVLCDEDGFVARIDGIASWLSLCLNHPEEFKIENPEILAFLKTRRFSTKPSQVNRELEQLTKTLQKLSPATLKHISDNYPDGPTLSWYYNLLSASKKPYSKIKSRNPDRNYLVEQMEKVVIEFDIHPTSYKNGELVKIVKIICDAANAPYDQQEVAKDVMKKIGG